MLEIGEIVRGVFCWGVEEFSDLIPFSGSATTPEKFRRFNEGEEEIRRREIRPGNKKLRNISKGKKNLFTIEIIQFCVDLRRIEMRNNMILLSIIIQIKINFGVEGKKWKIKNKIKMRERENCASFSFDREWREKYFKFFE